MAEQKHTFNIENIYLNQSSSQVRIRFIALTKSGAQMPTEARYHLKTA